jgi:hypothetical protein
MIKKINIYEYVSLLVSNERLDVYNKTNENCYEHENKLFIEDCLVNATIIFDLKYDEIEVELYEVINNKEIKISELDLHSVDYKHLIEKASELL